MAAFSVPSHVPEHLVRPYSIVMGATTNENPFKTIIPNIQFEPEIFYSTHAYPGELPSWVFRKAQDLIAIYQDDEHFTTNGASPFSSAIGESWLLIPSDIDPPQHVKYRRMINPLFMQRRIQGMDTRVRQLAREHIDRVRHSGQCEFMSEFAFRFPIAVFAELMGLPLERIDEFLEWEMMLLHAPSVEVMREGVMKVKDYLMGIIDERLTKPGDDFISEVLAMRMDGRPLSRDELLGFCFNLYVGGLDTVSTNMGWHFRHLAENQDHQDQLRSNVAAIPDAVEEMLRAYSAVTSFRTCTKSIVIRGVQLMPGDKAAMATFLANTDPDIFEQPSDVRLDRNPRHIAFGTGIHRCVGAPLARREIAIAIQEFLAAIPRFRLTEGRVLTTALGPVIQPKALGLSWN